MSQEARLSFIAEGMPILLASAQGYQDAATSIAERTREADVLVSFADEEAAKILILLDIVRCPPALVNQNVGKLIRWFYDHLARLIYAKAVGWKPTNIDELQRQVRLESVEYSLEGFAGEYILPSGPIFDRESSLYADIQTYDNGELAWHEPRARLSLFGPEVSRALRLCTILRRLGLLDLDGLRVISEIWSERRFVSTETSLSSKTLIQNMLAEMKDRGLNSDSEADADAALLFELWQLPMYELEIKPPPQTLDEMHEMQAMMLNDELGGG
jgi:hypothetical protein